MSDQARPFDIVLFGATGFAGGHAATRLGSAAPPGLTWAVAGRNRAKVQAVAARHGAGVLVADVGEPASMDALARSTRVVLSTAGPFAKLGDPVVDACVAAGTHYADLTGEVPWMRSVIDRHHLAARAQGTTLIPASGFDSVPADLAVFLAMDKARSDGLLLESVQTVYRLRGGLNGGTLASVLGIVEDGDPDLLQDPFALVPDASPTDEERAALEDPSRPRFDPNGRRWVAPFFMAAINRRVVRRTIELSRRGEAPALPADFEAVLDEGFRYDEFQSVSRGKGYFAAWGTTALLGAGFLALKTRPGRALVRRFGPSPGEGPSDKVLQSGLTQMTSTCRARERSSGQRADFLIRQELDGDPANLATVRMLVEVGLCLAAGEAKGGGVLTPMAALGPRLKERLSATGGHQISITEPAEKESLGPG